MKENMKRFMNYFMNWLFFMSAMSLLMAILDYRVEYLLDIGYWSGIGMWLAKSADSGDGNV